MNYWTIVVIVSVILGLYYVAMIWYDLRQLKKSPERKVEEFEVTPKVQDDEEKPVQVADPDAELPTQSATAPYEEQPHEPTAGEKKIEKATSQMDEIETALSDGVSADDFFQTAILDTDRPLYLRVDAAKSRPTII